MIDDKMFNILKECYLNDFPVKNDIALKIGISEADSEFTKLGKMGLIEVNESNNNWINLTPQGVTVYLNLLSQKKADIQALELNKQSIKSNNLSNRNIKLSIIVIVIAFLTLIFTIWQCFK